MIRASTRALALLAGAVGIRAQAPSEPRPPDRLALAEHALELEARWEPLTDTTYKFEEQFPWIRALAPAAARATYGADAFRPFLPPDDVPLTAGSVWPIDPADALPFLRQLHPGATAELHHGAGSGIAAPGAFACLRLVDAAHAEILFRVHAEFLLEGDGGRGQSSWLTPAQFRGRLVVDRARGEVASFELALPAQRANVDLNVATEHGTIADIGRIPRMEVVGGALPSYAPSAEQIPEDEARALLERRFYPFAELEWLDLAAARKASVATGKPLHVIALFGSLTDESC